MANSFAQTKDARFKYEVYEGDTLTSIINEFSTVELNTSDKLFEKVKNDNPSIKNWNQLKSGSILRLKIPRNIANIKKIKKYINIQRAKKYYSSLKNGGQNFLVDKEDKAKVLKSKSGNLTSIDINIKKELEYKINKKNTYIAPVYKYGIKALSENYNNNSTKLNDYYLMGFGIQFEHFQKLNNGNILDHYFHYEFSNSLNLEGFGKQTDMNALYKVRYFNFLSIFRTLLALHYDKTHSLAIVQSNTNEQFMRSTSSILMGPGIMGNLKIDIFEVTLEMMYLFDLMSSSEITASTTNTSNFAAKNISGGKFLLFGELLVLDKYFVRGVMGIHRLNGDSEVSLLKTEASVGYKFGF